MAYRNNDEKQVFPRVLVVVQSLWNLVKMIWLYMSRYTQCRGPPHSIRFRSPFTSQLGVGSSREQGDRAQDTPGRMCGFRQVAGNAIEILYLEEATPGTARTVVRVWRTAIPVFYDLLLRPRRRSLRFSSAVRSAWGNSSRTDGCAERMQNRLPRDIGPRALWNISFISRGILLAIKCSREPGASLSRYLTSSRD